MAEVTFPSGLVVRSRPFPKGFDPLNASDQELVGHALPPRPKDPTLQAQWENLMQSVARARFIEPEFRLRDRRDRTGKRNRTAAGDGLTLLNWSGGIVFPPGAGEGEQFKQIVAHWTAPNPLPANADVSVFRCASWVGIDGFPGTSGANVLFQVGVECDIDATETPPIYPWFQWVPADPHEIWISSIPVNVGDFVIGSVQGSGPGGPSNPFTSGSVVFRNVTRGYYTIFGVHPPAGTPPLAGSSAEWIVERPANIPEGGFWDLANYGSVTFDSASASTTFAGVLYDPSEGQPVTMLDGDGNVMSNASVAYRQVGCTFVSDALPA